jgi:hypothetical protein
MNARVAFFVLGLAQIGAGGLHFAWLGEMAAAMSRDGVPETWRQLTLLVTAAVGVLLCALGALAWRAATGGRWREPFAVALALVTAAAWAARTFLELRYPVQVALCGMTGLSPVVLGGGVLLVLVALGAAVLAGDSARAIPTPRHPLFEQHPLPVDYQDAYAIAVPRGTTLVQAMAEFCCPPWWMHGLMWLRDQAFARPLGLARRHAEFKARVAAGELFPVIGEAAEARLMGSADSHLEFQLLVFIATGPVRDELVMATRVRFKNRAGRLYFLPVKPGHRWLVPKLMARAAGRVSARTTA